MFPSKFLKGKFKQDSRINATYTYVYTFFLLVIPNDKYLQL